MSIGEMNFASLLENLMLNHTDVIYFKDLESRFIKVNEAFAHKHGWTSPKEAVGLTDFDIWTPEHAQEAFEAEQKIIKTGKELHGVEEQEVWPDGSVTWVSTTKVPLRDTDGTIIGTFGISRDITERKEAELKVRQYSDQIGAIKEEMENDVRMAGKLQKSFSSATYPVFPEGAASETQCIEFLHRFILNMQVSGDYCSILRVSDTEAGIFICDVQGAGIRAALGTALIRGILQEIDDLAGDPGAFLSRINSRLFPLLNMDGALLDTSACYVLLNLETGGLKMASAGHPFPLWFKGDSKACWLCPEKELHSPTLGVEAQVQYETLEFQIEPGDAVILFTDGLFSVKNNMDDAYGLKRLFDSAHSFAGEPLEDIFQGLEDDALAFSKDRKFSDDVCLVGFKFRQFIE
ncbi:SpoIIE family protein phosphatase [Pontiellaceae bacterium B12219]|nr:SpoIIE family protein phosphatase [Pontiellaceae bacterium B12219]